MVTSFLVLMMVLPANATEQPFCFFDLIPTNDGAALLASSHTGLKLTLIVENADGVPLIGDPIDVQLGGIPPTRTVQSPLAGAVADPTLQLLGLAKTALLFNSKEKEILFLNTKTGDLDTTKNIRIVQPRLVSKVAPYDGGWLIWGNHFLGIGPGSCGKKAFHIFDTNFKAKGCFGTGMDPKESMLKGDLATLTWSSTANTGYIFYPKSGLLFIHSPDGTSKQVATTRLRSLGEGRGRNIHRQKIGLLLMETGAGSVDLHLLDENDQWQTLASWKGDWVRALPLESHVLLVRSDGQIDLKSCSMD